MYQIHQNIITVPASVLFEELKIISYENYKKYCLRGKLKKVLNGGNGRRALIEYASLPPLFKEAIKKVYGDPYRQDDVERFLAQLKEDTDAYLFFEEYKYENGKGLIPEKIQQYYAEALILTLYADLVKRLRLKKHNGMTIKLGHAKKEICKVIQEIKGKKYPHRLPRNYRALDYKLLQYEQDGYAALVHKAVGNSNSKKIKGKAAEWILAQYSLPTKPLIPIVHAQYLKVRNDYGWPSLSESAISKWLTEPEQEKVWHLKRHGRASWQNKFGHKVIRDKSNWFPNVYWAIDGTKLDWLHYKDNQQGMGADAKIDVVFDVYSEKIIGFSFSQSETHSDHFRALKMSANTAHKRPYQLTYDGQSGHTSKRMQNMYDKLVARSGGKHYKHQARQHGSPVEQLFARFQQQVLNTLWFSDKQGVRTRKMDSQPNMEYLVEQSSKLHKFEDLERIFNQCVAEWNDMPHPKFQNETRNGVFLHEQPMGESLTIYDMMEIFWVVTPKAINYGTSGIIMEIDKEKHLFEVYDADGNVDIDFRDKYTHKKFFIQYDPEALDNYVRLYLKLPNGNMQYVADAQPKRAHESVSALMTPEKEARMWKDRKVRETELERIKKKLDGIQQRTGITAEGLMEDQEVNIKLGGLLPKVQRSAVESMSALDRM